MLRNHTSAVIVDHSLHLNKAWNCICQNSHAKWTMEELHYLLLNVILVKRSFLQFPNWNCTIWDPHCALMVMNWNLSLVQSVTRDLILQSILKTTWEAIQEKHHFNVKNAAKDSNSPIDLNTTIVYHESHISIYSHMGNGTIKSIPYFYWMMHIVYFRLTHSLWYNILILWTL